MSLFSTTEFAEIRFGKASAVNHAVTDSAAVVDFSSTILGATAADVRALSRGVAVDKGTTNKGRLTVRVDGWYKVKGWMNGSYATTASVLTLQLRKNGAAITTPDVPIAAHGQSLTGSIYHDLDCEGRIFLKKDDYIDMTIIRASGDNDNFATLQAGISAELVG